MTKKLDEVEKKYSMHKGWSQSDMEYKENLYAILLGKKEQLLFEIWRTGQRRIFLLNLKKYAGLIPKINFVLHNNYRL